MCKAPLPSVMSLPINLTLLDIITIYAIILSAPILKQNMHLCYHINCTYSKANVHLCYHIYCTYSKAKCRNSNI